MARHLSTAVRRGPGRLSLIFLVSVMLTWGVFALGVFGSSGDRQQSFRSCVSSCVKQNCGPNSPPLPLHLRLLLWTCPSDCDYQCQRKLTKAAMLVGGRVHQYHGKWPFIRILGIQEPASVVFSILNGLMHLKSWNMVRQMNPIHAMRKWLSLFIILGTWSWLCSAIFHTRDFALTEKLDYFSAGLNVLYILFLGVVRALRLDRWRETKSIGVVFLFFYLLHVGYLSLVKFDYGYNMKANAIVGLLSNVVWMVVALQAYRNGQPIWWKPLVLILLTDAAFSLELFDFAPLWDTFDAHSLWHAATIPIVGQWYEYLVMDSKWDARLDQLRKN